MIDWHDDDARPQLRQAMLAAGCPPPLADQLVDLGFHAANEACAALDRVAATAPRSELTVWGIAAGLIKQRMDRLEDALTAYGQNNGLKSHAIQIRLGAEA